MTRPSASVIVATLPALCDYVVQGLIRAHLHNDVPALDEADRLLENIASAWREIDDRARG